MATGFLIICMATAGFAMVAQRLASTSLTAPMVFLALGYVLSSTGLVSDDSSHALLHPVAEITLVILLFLDAAQTDLAALRRRHIWPSRMLLIGLPLAIALGALAGAVLLPTWPFVAVLLMAAILAPTDAALGQAVVTNPNVPIRPRRALTVESGLNDGLALPIILLFASLTAAEMDVNGGAWLVFGLKQIVLGPLVGIAVGALGGWILLRAKARHTTSDIYEGVGALALAGSAYLAATEIGGNGFISAFVAGLTFGGIVKGACKFVYEFTESEGQLLAWASFLLLGAALVPEAIAHLTWPMLALILISLFLVRPLAIWLSLIGTDAAPLTRVFFGWFGPRGLATALFALLVIDEIPAEIGEPILHIAINAVWISAVLHGITAAPAARWYGRKLSESGTSAETETIEHSAKPIITRRHSE
ncbi:cation:proton antiporter [Gymnodinialimonas sp. 2305UL16-5]|uniref:cation:proton antiporter n=1 Tax=Gymnodinialimonas mytili TaxID=3126503 RepID=UPI0030ACB367